MVVAGGVGAVGVVPLVVVAGVGPLCCMLSIRVVSAVSWAIIDASSELSFVDAFAICVRALAKAVSFDEFVTLVITMVAAPVAAPPNALACALSRRRRSTFAWRYFVCHAAHVFDAVGRRSHSRVASGLCRDANTCACAVASTWASDIGRPLRASFSLAFSSARMNLGMPSLFA